ncbi:MAG: DUF177 domain-containing protein [Dehalococcoidia bacterium]|nr:DUF177 domain-containing protein [Dehalococcoidia bacterium]
MKINVSQQLMGPLGDRRTYSIDEFTPEGYSVKALVTLVRTNRSILVTGQAKTASHSICSRCLEEFEHSLAFKIEEEFFPARDVVTDEPLLTSEEIDGFTIGQDHIMDLSEAVRQNIQLNLPIKTICQPKCAGLCQQCGHNLNHGPCHCSEEPADPRWSALREILSR